MNIDFWYGGKLEDVTRISCSFSDRDFIYRGWMYDSNNNVIGDYYTTNSVEIEQIFKVNFD